MLRNRVIFTVDTLKPSALPKVAIFRNGPTPLAFEFPRNFTAGPIRDNRLPFDSL